MIDRIIISGYRCFEHLDLEPNPGLNIIVGDNECGKSTLLEAVALALTGRVNGKWATEELNPFWFYQQGVIDFFAASSSTAELPPPTVLIELYFQKDIDALQRLRGVHNSAQEDCPGVALNVSLAEEYRGEFESYMKSTLRRFFRWSITKSIGGVSQTSTSGSDRESWRLHTSTPEPSAQQRASITTLAKCSAST